MILITDIPAIQSPSLQQGGSRGGVQRDGPPESGLAGLSLTSVAAVPGLGVASSDWKSGKDEREPLPQVLPHASHTACPKRPPVLRRLVSFGF